MPLLRRVTFQAVTVRCEGTSIKENVSLQQAVLHACPEEFDMAGDPPSTRSRPHQGQRDTTVSNCFPKAGGGGEGHAAQLV